MQIGKKLQNIEKLGQFNSFRAVNNQNYKSTNSHRSLQQLECLLVEQQSKERQQVQKIQHLHLYISEHIQMIIEALPQSQRMQAKTVCDSLIQNIESQVDNHIKIANTQNRIQITKKQISYFNNKVDEYVKQGLDQDSFKSLQIKALLLQQKIEQLQCQIQKSDPIHHEQFCCEQLISLKAQLEPLTSKQASLTQILSIKKLEETIQKNKLVVQLGKYQALQKEQEQRRQKLKSLIRHSEQIKQRIAIMRKQSKMKVNKKNSKQDVNKQIEAVQKENMILQQQIFTKQGDLKRLIQQIQKCGTRQKMQQLEMLIKQLRSYQQSLENQVCNVKQIQIQIDKFNVEYQTLKKERKKKIYKKDKRLKNSQSLIFEVEKKLYQTKQKVEQKQKQSQRLYQELLQLELQIKQPGRQILEQKQQPIKHMQHIEKQFLRPLPQVELKQKRQIDLHKKQIKDQFSSDTDSQRNVKKENEKSALASEDQWYHHLGWSFMLILFLIVLCTFVIYL